MTLGVERARELLSNCDFPVIDIHRHGIVPVPTLLVRPVISWFRTNPAMRPVDLPDWLNDLLDAEDIA